MLLLLKKMKDKDVFRTVHVYGGEKCRRKRSLVVACSMRVLGTNVVVRWSSDSNS